MRYFSAVVTKVGITRKQGYYLSSRQATTVARKMASVLELSASQMSIVIRYLQGDHLEDFELAFTPKETEVISNFLWWYNYELGAGDAFVMHNLNTGSSVVFCHLGNNTES